MHLFKRAPKISLLFALCLLLVSCSSVSPGPEERVRSLRQSLSDMDALSAHAVLTADYGERVFRCTAAIEGNAHAGTMTVEEPENIAGTVLQWSDGSMRLRCEDITLETGALSDHLSPGEAVPVLLSACQTGQLLECGWEEKGELLYAQFSHPDYSSLAAACWFDSRSGGLRRCELSEEGRCVLTLDFSDFSLRGRENSP